MFDFFPTKGFKNYVKQARKILDENWTGRYTKPSPRIKSNTGASDQTPVRLEHMDIIEVEYLFYDWNLNH